MSAQGVPVPRAERTARGAHKRQRESMTTITPDLT